MNFIGKSRKKKSNQTKKRTDYGTSSVEELVEVNEGDADSIDISNESPNHTSVSSVVRTKPNNKNDLSDVSEDEKVSDDSLNMSKDEVASISRVLNMDEKDKSGLERCKKCVNEIECLIVT